MKLAASMALVLVVCTPRLATQEPARFEVASVKPARPLTMQELLAVSMRPIRVSLPRITGDAAVPVPPQADSSARARAWPI